MTEGFVLSGNSEAKLFPMEGRFTHALGTLGRGDGWGRLKCEEQEEEGVGGGEMMRRFQFDFLGVVDGGVGSSNCCFLEIPESCSQ